MVLQLHRSCSHTSERGSLSCSLSRLPRTFSRNYSPQVRPHVRSRNTLVIECKESRVGKKPVTAPAGVTVALEPGLIKCTGPKGELVTKYNNKIIKVEETEEKGTFQVSKKIDTRQAHMSHGLVRSLFDGMLEGLSTGFTKSLNLVGVGYRATLGAKELTLNLGYSLPVVMQIPEGIEVQVERNTTVHVRGFDKCQVGQFAADIRSKRPPEPYKGKGVKYTDEIIVKKEGKRGKK